MEDPLLRLLLIPPPVSPDVDQDDSPLESILLDPHGYISARENASTAEGFTRDGHLIPVTFWAARAPRVSCFTVHVPDVLGASVPSAFGDIPKVLSTEGDLVLLRVALFPDADGCGGAEVDPSCFEYFVYQAGDTIKKRPPPLHPILTPPFLEFSGRAAVLLRCRGRGAFFVAILRRRPFDRERFDVHLYNSKTGDWSTKMMCPSQTQEEYDYYYSCKAISIGGELGSVAWVDLWHGILIYDVLLDSNYFRYIPLPSPVESNRLKSNPMLTRDIVVVDGYIKFFDMHTYYMKLADTGYA